MDDPLRRRSEDPAASSDPERVSRLARFGAPLGLGLAAFALRALPWRSQLDAGRVVFHDNDAYYHARRIFYTGENVAPDMAHCDFAFGFLHEERVGSERYRRLPNYVLRLWANGHASEELIKPELSAPELLAEKTRFCNFVYSNPRCEARNRFFEKLSRYKRVDAAGPLANNLGWTLHDRGDYAAALESWRDALAARETMGDIRAIRIARWTVARGLRSLRRLDEAEAIQRALASELASAGMPDGYVFEELAEIALARGDRAGAQPWAAQAIAILAADPAFRTNDAARLARLADIAQPQAHAR